MKLVLAALAVFIIAAPLAVSAATVSINYTSYTNAQVGQALLARDTFMTGPAVGEEFENFTACNGSNSLSCANGTIITSVGTFTGIGPAITNGASQVLPKDKIVVRTSVPAPFGRFNTTPGAGSANWLDSNDLNGILWTLVAPGTTYFDKIAFFLTDLDDVGNVRFSIQANGGAAVERTGVAGDGRLHLVTMRFDTGITNLSIRMVNGAGDGFGFDGARVAAVPVPAAGFLLLGALGGLAAMRRRRKA